MIVAIVSSACGGDDNGSGLPTLAGDAAEAVELDVAEAGARDSEPEASSSDDVETARVADAQQPATTASEADDASATDPQSPTSSNPEAESVAQDPDTETPDDVGEQREDLSPEERLLEFADCMRDNGVDFPDPVVEADGTVNFGLRLGRQSAQGAQALAEIGRDPDLPAAREACQYLVEGIALGEGRSGFDQTELQDTLLEFAQCMRDNGVDMGDPDLSAFGPGSQRGAQPSRPFGGVDFSDADVAEAFEVCQEQVSLPGPGRGGRPQP